ncbi:hypothetical protein CDIK_0072 [Cucumispora dikerogammari]|nr:hypothetical protein CDIK_0072 [Cucumispora dikerogammari]
MRFFQKMEISHTSLMGKKDIKLLNKQTNCSALDFRKEYKISKYKNKFFIVSDSYPLFFNVDNIYFPTLRYLNNESGEYKVAVLDDGAYKPILRGADVMAGGILKNYALCDEFKVNDVVVIKITDEIVGIGLATVNKKDIKLDSSGIVIEIYHYKGDDLNLFLL